MTPDEIARSIIEEELIEALNTDEGVLELLLEATGRQTLIDYYNNLTNALVAVARGKEFNEIGELTTAIAGSMKLKPLYDRINAEIEKATGPMTALMQRLSKIANTYRTKEQQQQQQQQQQHRTGLKAQDAGRATGVAKPGGLWGRLRRFAKAESIDMPDDVIYEIISNHIPDFDLLLERLEQGIPKQSLINAYGEIAGVLGRMLRSPAMQKVQDIMINGAPMLAREVPKLPDVMKNEYKKMYAPLAGLLSRLTAAVDKLEKGIGVEKVTRKKTQADTKKEQELAKWREDMAARKKEAEGKRLSRGPGGKPGRMSVPSTIEQIARDLQPL